MIKRHTKEPTSVRMFIRIPSVLIISDASHCQIESDRLTHKRGEADKLRVDNNSTPNLARCCIRTVLTLGYLVLVPNFSTEVGIGGRTRVIAVGRL